MQIPHHKKNPPRSGTRGETKTCRQTTSRPRGFTLAEIIIVIFLISLLAVAALVNFFSPNKTMVFISEYKNVLSSVRTARSYAINSKTIADGVPERYGVHITNGSGGTQEITIFAEPVGGGEIAFLKDDSDHEISTYQIDNNDYIITAQDSNENHLNLSLTLFYETGSADFSVKNLFGFVDKAEDKFISLKFENQKQTMIKYIVIFQVSGLSEELNQLPSEL